MRSRKKIVMLICFVLMLFVFFFWELTRPMTPKNYNLDAFILSNIKRSYESENIDAAIVHLKSELKIKDADKTILDKKNVLIVNKNTITDTHSFLAICHIGRRFFCSNMALVLYKDGRIEKIENWRDLVTSNKHIEYYEVIIK